MITLETKIGQAVKFCGSASVGDDRIYTVKEFIFDDIEDKHYAVLAGGMFDQHATLDILEKA